MRICRYDNNRLGVVIDDRIFDVSEALDVIPASTYPLPTNDPLIANLDKIRQRIDTLLPKATSKSINEVKLLSPVANPGKLVAAPVNYMKHLQEARADQGIHNNNQILEIQKIGLFLKANSSLIGAGTPVQIRHHDRRNDHEIELAVIIGKPGVNIKKENALDYIAGYAIGLDMTVRGPEERSLLADELAFQAAQDWSGLPRGVNVEISGIACR